MGKQIKGSLYFMVANTRASLFTFWTILLSIVAISLIIAYFLLNRDNGFMTFSLTVPMYIYCAILGFITVKESIPFLIKMGATRKNIFISLGVFFLGIALLNAFVGSIIQVIMDLLNKQLGIGNFKFLHLTYFLQDTWLNRIAVDTAVMFFLFAIMFVIGLLFYRYGLVGGGSVIGLLVIFMLTAIALGWLVDFFIHIFKTFDNIFFYQLFGIGLVIYCLSFIFLRRITTLRG